VARTAVVTWLLAASAQGADFASPGGPAPANLAEVATVLRQDPYDLELLISFGTSKGGSAGHLALAIRDQVPGDDLVYSANFYADRARKHAKDFYTEELMVRIPKLEYLYGTTSTLSAKASFGLDFGEVYKRSVIGVRVYGIAPGEKQKLASYFDRMNDDYRKRAFDTEYHRGEVRYDYLRLNCAKTIGSAFRYGAGYSDLDVASAVLFSGRRLVAAANANLPTEMAMKLLDAWNTRGYQVDVVFYRKYSGSTWSDPHEEEKIAFKNLPNRFPSVLSRDFRKDQGEYEDVDNLFSMYLLYNLAKYSVRVDEQTRALAIENRKNPMTYADAVASARQSATADGARYIQGDKFRPQGTRIGEAAN